MNEICTSGRRKRTGSMHDMQFVRSAHESSMPGLRVVSQRHAAEVSTDKVVWKPEKRKKAVFRLIRSAKHSLLLSVFRCNDLGVLDELGKAAARGVRVEVLITGRAKGWAKRLEPMAGVLSRLGVAVHRFHDSEKKYHAKYMVADNSRCLIGTLNLTRKCFRSTSDFLMLSDDPELVSSLAALFHADTRGSAIEPPATGRLIVGPEHAREGIEAVLSGAKESIRIMDHKISDPHILALLTERERKGVRVEIERDNTRGLTPHGRIIIVDSAVAVLGSFSLTTRSLDERREIAVLIRDENAIAKLDRHFETQLESLREAAA